MDVHVGATGTYSCDVEICHSHLSKRGKALPLQFQGDQDHAQNVSHTVSLTSIKSQYLEFKQQWSQDVQGHVQFVHSILLSIDKTPADQYPIECQMF